MRFDLYGKRRRPSSSSLSGLGGGGGAGWVMTVVASAESMNSAILGNALATAPHKAMILGHIPPASSIPASEEGYTSGKMPGNTAPGVQLWWQSHLERYNAMLAASGKVTYELFGTSLVTTRPLFLPSHRRQQLDRTADLTTWSAGHVHVDTYFVSRTGSARPGGGRAPTGVAWVGLSLVASYPPKNGGVRRYSYDNQTKQPTDITQWFYDVPTSNRTGKLEWKKSWTASEDLAQPGHKRAPGVCPFSEFLKGNLCADKDMIGASGSKITTVEGCYQWCAADKNCSFFAVAPAPLPWCIRYSSCTARSQPDSKYATYSMKPSTAPCDDAGLLSPVALHNLTLGWRDNHTAHQEFRSRAFGRASPGIYPSCSGADPAVGRRCRMIDTCAVANSAPSEYALCLLNWDCADGDIGRGDVCTPREGGAK